MSSKPIKVLHLNTEKGWRGGENQIKLFVENCPAASVQNYFAGLKGHEAIGRFSKVCPTLELDPNENIFRHVKTIIKFCHENHIQILDAQTSKAHTIGLLVKRKMPEIKLLVHRRVDNLPGTDFINQWKYRTSKVDQYVAISQAIADILTKNNIGESRIAVVPSATDSTPFENLDKHAEKQELAKAFSLDSSLPFLGNASALSHQKGYSTLIRAIKILKDSHIKMHCFIAGDGDQRTELEEMRRDLDLDQEITFLGFIKEVPTFLTALDVLAVPSNNEGLGTIILDGTHAGCAIVASKIGGIPEIIQHQQTGILIEPGDAQQLADSLQILLNDRDMQIRFNSNAKELVRAKFSLEAMVSGNIAQYQRLIN